MLKRSNVDTNQGTYRETGKRGLVIETPVGKDSSDYAGKPSEEVTSRMRMPFNSSSNTPSLHDGSRGTVRKLGDKD